MKINSIYTPLVLLLSVLVIGCNPFKNNNNKSQATGWDISSKNGGYKNNKAYKGQNLGPGLTFIEGGTYTKGNVKDNVMHDWNNTPTQQYVRSFLIDETEVTNSMYVEYLFWMNKVFAKDKNSNLYKIYTAALPDTLVWRNPLGFNEDMVNNYLRHPAFENHPVVGVSWQQATNYAKWRTDRVNELILVKNGYLTPGSIHPDSLVNGYSFNTKAYLLNPKESFNGRIDEMADNKQTETDENDVKVVNYAKRENGLLLPEYRLPTETEWEYAALALSEITEDNKYRGKKKFPWDGEYTRSGKRKNQGDQLANFKLGKGDYGGIAGWSKTGSGITTGVRSYPANDFGLYGMAGNVAEWVADVYRPIIDDEMNDISYYRGNEYFKPSIGDDGKVRITKPDGVTYDKLPGSIDTDSISRNLKSFNDGDNTSSRNPDGSDLDNSKEAKDAMYNSRIVDKDNDGIPDKDWLKNGDDRTTLISDEARVYKGGSWLDRAYYLDPAQRRYELEYKSSNFIGFRCAMSYLGESRNSKKSRKR
ncbi:gliding motility lipoprotein GldJ [Flavobacteriaceae bacterium]|nr:gliding motility lipoprotein GldJ [Flavobacteriaceae bacterium]